MKPHTQRTAGWILLCIAALTLGLAFACFTVSNTLSELARHPTTNSGVLRHAAQPWSHDESGLLVIMFLTFLSGAWMVREARRRERGNPPGYPLIVFEYLVASIRSKINSGKQRNVKCPMS